MTQKNNQKGNPLADVYCRGCHARPSFKNISTYLCNKCWDRWNEVRRSAKVLDESEVGFFKEELTAFIKARNRYVWHPEVYLYFRPVSIDELKKHGIKVATICRELRLFAPPDDRITRETVERVEKFVTEYMKAHQKVPGVREVLAWTKLDHTTLWSCMDFEEFVRDLGGKINTDVRYRFRNENDFLLAAAEVVKKAGCPLHMTVILEEMGVSYPAYLDNFGAVTSEEIHEKAGISRSLDGVDSLLEAAARAALNRLGWQVEAGVSFPDLFGKENRPMKFDLKLVDSDTLVEIDGAQHFDSDNFMFKKNIVENDAMKDEYARRNGLRLIRVDARKIRTPKAMMKFFHQHIGRGPHGPINPSNAINTSSAKRRKPMRGSTRRRPRGR